MPAVNTHNIKVGFGVHSEKLWTRVPINYLKWIVNKPDMEPGKKLFAQSELDRRGVTTPTDLEISGHAIDRASLRCWSIYLATRNHDEGLHSWLYRVAVEALNHIDCEGNARHRGIKFCFQRGDCYPTLMTVVNGG